MENFNTIPSAGTYGSAIALINANFSLTKEQLERLSYSREGFCGMYETDDDLEAAYPHPTTGSFAYVGTSFPMTVYLATNGVWAASSSTYSGGEIDLNQYADKASLDALAGRVTALENAGYVFIGIATPAGAPSPSQAKRFALAWAAGTYTYYGGFVLNSGEMAVLMYNGSAWSGAKTDIIAKGVAGGYDTTPTEDSEKPITSGGVYTAMDELRSDMEEELSNVDMEFGSGEYVSDVIIHNSVGQNESVLLTQGGITSFVFNEIDINDIDNLNNVDYAYSPSQSQSKKTSYYTVVTFRGTSATQKVKIGTMAVISDGLASTVTEVMTTRYTLDASGNLTGEFSNNDVFTIYRSTSGNTWTQWHYVNESVWEEAINGIRTDLTNYYTKSQTYSKTEVDNLLAAVKQFKYRVVSSLPAPSINTMGEIYLVPAAQSATQNVKDEYITIWDGNLYKWEQIGSTAVDLSGYSTTAEMNTAINAAIASALISYYTKTQVDTLLDEKQDIIDDLATIRSGAAAGATAVQPDAMNSAISSAVSMESARIRASIGYYECSTAAATAAKAVSASGYTLTNGGCIRIKMMNGNTANNVTLNINSTGAKALYYDGAQASSTNTWEAGEVLEVYYDGTQYQCSSGGGGKFATGEQVKDISLLDELNGSRNIPKSSAILNYLQPLMIANAATDVQYGEVTTGVQIENGKWVTQAPRQIYLIPYTYHEGDYLRIKGGNTNVSGSLYAFLTSNDHTVGHNVPFCEPNETEWTQVLPDVQVDVPIPSTCTYLAINKSYNTSNFVPQLLQIIGLEIFNAQEVVDDVNVLETRMNAVEGEMFNSYQFISSDFEQGSISSDNGYYISSTTRLRLKALHLLKAGDKLSFKVNGQEYGIYYYTTAGVYTTAVAWLSEDAVYTIQDDCKVNIIVRKPNNGTIVPSDLAMVIKHTSEVIDKMQGDIETLQTRVNALNNSNESYDELFLGSLVQGGMTTSEIDSNNKRVTTVSCMVVPYIGAKMKMKLPSGYKVDFRSGGAPNHLNNLDYWYYDGDTYTFRSDARYFRACFAKNTEEVVTAEEVDALVASGDIKLLLPKDDGVVECNHESEKYTKAAMRPFRSSGNSLLLTALPTFLHTSDLHGDAKRCDRFMDYADFLEVDGALITGDMVANNRVSSKQYVDDIAKTHLTPQFQCLGNHECMDGTPVSTQAAMIATCIERVGGVVDPNATYPTYYYKDFTSKSIRLIVLNLYESTHTDTEGWHFPQAQCEWFISALASTPADYGVIVMMHAPETIPPIDPTYGLFRQPILRYTSTGFAAKPFAAIIDAFIGKTSATVSYTSDSVNISVQADFTGVNSGVEFIAYVNGHLHADVTGYIADTTHKQLDLNICCGSTIVYGNTSDLPRGGKGSAQDSFNLYVIDRTAGTVRIARVGSNTTGDFTERKYLIIPYRDNA